MRTTEEINQKIKELQKELEEKESEFEEELESDDIDEFSEQGERMRDEFDFRMKAIKKQIKILEWVLSK